MLVIGPWRCAWQRGNERRLSTTTSSEVHLVAYELKPGQLPGDGTMHAYTSTGVRTACVNAQQKAPARAYLAYRETSAIPWVAVLVHWMFLAGINLSRTALTASPGFGA